MRRLPWMCALAALAAASSAWAAPPKTVAEHAAAGEISADFFYLRTGKALANGAYGAFRIRISRAGEVALFKDIVCRYCFPVESGKPGKAVHIARLAPDAEPVVIVDLDTGGAHCCSVSALYAWTGAAYREIHADWGDPGYALSDIRHDGAREFVTADDRFAYEFTDYAHSAMPIRIFALQGVRLVDVTRSFPTVAAHDAAQLWRNYEQAHATHDGTRGILAAWAADEALLGRWTHAKAVLSGGSVAADIRTDTTEPRNGTGPFLRHLERFLRRNGYLG